VLVCVDRNSKALAGIRESGGFTVNVLAADSHLVADRMATMPTSKSSK
jgi:flavin reductase (DIM6/NTAB) family NADH-FMN oxidoreductase RutF